jgi:16S rRNA (uracil1498-N3)-methyltransferase
MRRLRFFCETIDSQCTLDETESHHLSRVLRIEEGAPVEVFDGRGTLAEGTVERIERRHVTINTHRITRTPRPDADRLILAVSYAKGQRFDWLVEKCTELGADHIAAVQFERTVKLGNENAVERLKKISLAAVKQSGRLYLPELSGPLRLEPTFTRLKQQYPNALFCCGDPNGQSPASILAQAVNKDILVLVGPEGGFAPDESLWMASENILPISINQNILRVETAAVAFCALLKAPRS